MPPLNDKKLEKIQKLLEIANEDFATPEDVIKMSEALISVVIAEKNKLETLIKDADSKASNSISKTLSQLTEKENGLRAVIAQLSTNTSKAITDTQNTLSKEIKRVEAKIPSKTDLTGIESQIEAIQEALVTVPTEITANPEAVRNALELLSDDERLDKTAIRGLDELIEDLKTIAKTSQPQAVGVRLLRYLSDVNIDGITNGQTLIWNSTTNRFEPGSGGGGGGSSTWGSITGTLSDQTDLQTALNAKATPADITTAINNLVDTAPGTLDTLNELAAALGDDPNFATTVTTALAGKANTTHTHVIADTTGLQTALDSKAATSHTHTLANVTDVTMTVANLNSLDDGVDSTLHFHAADRARANHTGTQTASTISDFASTARSTVLTGLSLATSQVIAATDTIVLAFGYLQAQITALTTTVAAKVASVTAGTNVTVTGTSTAPVVNVPTMTATVGGAVPTPPNNTTTFLRGDGTFAAPPGGGSGITRSVTVTSGNVSAGSTAATDYVYFVAGAHTVSLPAASGNTNLYTIKNNHSANITVDTVGAETLDGTASISLAPEESVQIISNGTNYFIV